MTMYDVTIRDPDEYAGGFEVRIPDAADCDEAIAEALAEANSDGAKRYSVDDVISVSEVTIEDAQLDEAEGQGRR